MVATDEEIAQLSSMVEGCAELALTISLPNVGERLHVIMRELDNQLGDRLVRKYRGRFKNGTSS